MYLYLACMKDAIQVYYYYYYYYEHTQFDVFQWSRKQLDGIQVVLL